MSSVTYIDPTNWDFMYTEVEYVNWDSIPAKMPEEKREWDI